MGTGLSASFYVKPSGKFWKRYFNKKVRHGQPGNSKI